MSTSPYLDTKAHEEYIYHRLQEISKKISPTPPLNFQPTNGSPRQILNSSKASLAPHQGSLHTEEVKELSNLVMALQDNLRRIQQDYLQVLVKSDHETQHRISLEQILSQISTELNETQLALEEKQQVIDKIQNDFQQLQVQYNQRERQLQNLNEENETYLQKLQSVQAELRKSDERNRENDKSRNDSLVEMKQQILQFKIDLEFATSHISLLSAQKNQVNSHLIGF